ncbi:MAG: acyl-CoA desaturase [Planctomycetota bacterium]|jgi:stearoyl-CoA desaturase (delta-9 desaturase)
MNRTRLDWSNFLFVSAAHLVAAFAIVYLAVFHFSWWTIGFGFLWGTLCGLSITGGYHRLFSHSAYTATWPLRLFYLAFGAASCQNSALSWAADHRQHHAHTDRDRDPYSIRRGFWWAHIGWVLCKGTRNDNHLSVVKDLEADPLIRFQHRHYVLLAILFAAIVPAAVGTAWGDPIGALLVAGWLRLVVQWHATFAVNSFAHLIGSQPYGKTGSARDSLLVALLTMGEGYHNFHHRFQVDYRNGIRWYHFDPTKWWVWTASRFGLARKLRRVPPERVRAARLAAQVQANV